MEANKNYLNDLLNYFALASAFSGCAYVANNFITHVFEMPGLFGFLNFIGFSQFVVQKEFTSIEAGIGFIQALSFLIALIAPIYIFRFQKDSFRNHAILDDFVLVLISSAFWAVLLIGIADAIISFLRIEDLLKDLVGEDLALSLGKPPFRGTFVHLPLAVLGFLIGFFRRGIEFIWLALLIVLAELLIVFTRFIFSYEQAFMGDLVRFWYAALFLFASAYTLINDGHVRVDVIYASFSTRKKAIVNMVGSLVLGIPLCWIVLSRGLWTDSSIFNLSLLNFEVTQQGYGMYVKYIMSSFLIIFALSMLIQFSSFIISEMNKFENFNESNNVKPKGNA